MGGVWYNVEMDEDKQVAYEMALQHLKRAHLEMIKLDDNAQLVALILGLMVSLKEYRNGLRKCL